MDLQPLHCLELLATTLKAKSQGNISLHILEQPDPAFRQFLLHNFQRLSVEKDWANGRDVIDIAKRIMLDLLRSPEVSHEKPIVLTKVTVQKVFDDVLKMHKTRQRTLQRQGFDGGEIPGGTWCHNTYL